MIEDPVPDTGKMQICLRIIIVVILGIKSVKKIFLAFGWLNQDGGSVGKVG